VTAGTPLRAADVAAVLVHGRGATAESVVRLADEFYQHGLALVAPRAEKRRWYPNSFLAPVAANEPWLSSGLQAVGDALDEVTGAGVPAANVLLLGVSQGACLVSEFLARDPRRYGGAVVASGGLLGPDIDASQYDGTLEGTPVLVSGTTDDPHVPVDRLRETGAVFERLDGDVTGRIDEGSGHGVGDEGLAWASERVARLVSKATRHRSHGT
jgi:phospholipase/carboxylesterase